MRTLLLALAAALVLPASALAGGWATVSLSSTPDGLAAGDTWTVDIEVLQHGRTPLDGVRPQIRLEGPDGTRSFGAKPTGQPGMYRADVELGSAGKYTYEVDDGFSQVHGYPPVGIGTERRVVDKAPATEQTAGPGEDDGPWLALGAALAAGLLVAGAVALRARRA
jgi:hypothetical protein